MHATSVSVISPECSRSSVPNAVLSDSNGGSSPCATSTNNAGAAATTAAAIALALAAVSLLIADTAGGGQDEDGCELLRRGGGGGGIIARVGGDRGDTEATLLRELLEQLLRDSSSDEDGQRCTSPSSNNVPAIPRHSSCPT